MSAVRATAAALAALILGACAAPEAEPEKRTLAISGTARLADASPAAGTLHVQAYFAWKGEGHLRYPLGEIGGFTAEGPEFTGTVSYPAGVGEGLVVFAWLDSDGDGVHCTPANRTEPAGIAVLNELPAEEARVELVLTENCRSAGWFFPPATS